VDYILYNLSWNCVDVEWLILMTEVDNLAGWSMLYLWKAAIEKMNEDGETKQINEVTLLFG